MEWLVSPWGSCSLWGRLVWFWIINSTLLIVLGELIHIIVTLHHIFTPVDRLYYVNVGAGCYRVVLECGSLLGLDEHVSVSICILPSVIKTPLLSHIRVHYEIFVIPPRTSFKNLITDGSPSQRTSLTYTPSTSLDLFPCPFLSFPSPRVFEDIFLSFTTSMVKSSSKLVSGCSYTFPYC